MDGSNERAPFQMPGPHPCDINMFGSCMYTFVGFGAAVGRGRQCTRRPCRQCAALLCLWCLQLTWARVASVVGSVELVGPCGTGSVVLCLDASTDADDWAGFPWTLQLKCTRSMPITANDNTHCTNKENANRNEENHEKQKQNEPFEQSWLFSARTNDQSRIPDYT